MSTSEVSIKLNMSGANTLKAIQETVLTFGWSVLELGASEVLVSHSAFETMNRPTKIRMTIESVDDRTSNVHIIGNLKAIGRKTYVDGLVGKLVNALSVHAQRNQE